MTTDIGKASEPEEIMSKSETMTKDTDKAGEPAALTDKELDAVTGGATPTYEDDYLGELAVLLMAVGGVMPRILR